MESDNVVDCCHDCDTDLLPLVEKRELVKQVLVLDHYRHRHLLAKWRSFQSCIVDDYFNGEVQDVDESVEHIYVIILPLKADEHDHSYSTGSYESVNRLKLHSKRRQHHIGRDDYGIGYECAPAELKE